MALKRKMSSVATPVRRSNSSTLSEYIFWREATATDYLVRPFFHVCRFECLQKIDDGNKTNVSKTTQRQQIEQRFCNIPCNEIYLICRKSWKFVPQTIEQCRGEMFSETEQRVLEEGCQVRKIPGMFLMRDHTVF